MYEYDYDEEDGMSLLDIIKVSFGIDKVRRILFGIIGISIALIVFLFTELVYSNSKKNYTATFSYDIPSMQIVTDKNNPNITKITYLNGTEFNYNTIVSYNNLLNAKNSDEKFKDLDIDYLFENTAITISYESSSDKPYVLNIRKKYFNDESLVKDYAKALANLPLNETKNMLSSINNTEYINLAKTANLSYEEVLNNLINQSKYLTKKLAALILDYPNLLVDYDNKKVNINTFSNIISSKLSNLDLNLLRAEAQDNAYIRNYNDDEVKNAISLKYDNIKAEQTRLEAVITSYNNSLGGISSLDLKQLEDYFECVEEKANIDALEPVYLNYKTNGKESAEYEAKVIKAINDVEEITNVYSIAEISAYQDSSNNVYYKYNSIVEKTGGINIFVEIVLALVAGVVIAAIVNLILGYSAYKNNKFSNKNKKENKTEISENKE